MPAEVRLGARWRLWRQFSLRGAGFPADGVLRLVPPGLAEAADATGGTGGDFEQDFATAAAHTAKLLQEIAADPRFQTALAWQNRALLDRAIRPFLAWTATPTSRTSVPRQREELVAHYWQRLCVKNDTIGFFGPVGWGDLDPFGEPLTIEPGTGLTTRSTTYFSSWAIDTLAKAITADPRLRPWIPPRRIPYARADGSIPGRRPQPLPGELVEVLARCDGVRTPAEIAAELGADVTAAVAELARRRLVGLALDIPADAHPERHLRAWLGRVGDDAARRDGLAALDALERARDRIHAAAGIAELQDGMAALETEFTARTAQSAVRAKSAHTAPCRALAYADSVRSARVRLGPAVLDALGPLDPLMTSAVWLTSALAAAVRGRIDAVYDRLAAAGPVDLAAFWFGCLPVLHGDATADAARLRAEFWRRWQQVLRLPPGVRRARLSTVDIADAVAEVFGGAGDGWTAARYLSPDVLIAATGADAVARGEYELVLGELHVATNTVAASLYVNQHPDAAELFAETDRDHPGPRLLPMLPKEHRARLSARIRPALVRPADYCVALVEHTADPRRPRTVRSAEVRVERRAGLLVAVLPDGAAFDVLDAFAHVLTSLVIDQFRVLPPDAPHSPRVTVDRMVIARECWAVDPAAMPFLDDKSEARRFARARRWATELGLPRFVFVVAPTEPRPFYVDFASPLYTGLFTKAARRLARATPGAALTVTEMLPTPEQTWLTDDRGNRYTAELRFVAADHA